MKQIVRMILFSAIALFLTLLWNKGISFQYTVTNVIIALLVISVLFYLIRPLVKLIFLPVNFFTFGLISFLVNLVLFVFSTRYFHIFTIAAWVFPGFNLGPISIPKLEIGYWPNALLSSLSISFIINSLETLI